MTAVTHNDVIALVSKANVIPDVGKFRRDVKLSDQGIDSLGFFNVLLLVGEKYKIEIPDSDLNEVLKVDAIVEYLNDRIS